MFKKYGLIILTIIIGNSFLTGSNIPKETNVLGTQRKDLLEIGSPSPIVGSSEHIILGNDFRPKGTSPKYYLSKQTLCKPKPYQGDNKFLGTNKDMGIGCRTGLTACLNEGTYKGYLFLGRINLSSDTLFIYESTNGGSTWSDYGGAVCLPGWAITNFSISAGNDKLLWFVEFDSTSSKTELDLFFTSFNRDTSYGFVIDQLAGCCCPSITNDAVDCPYASWAYLAYSRPESGYELKFKAIDEAGGVHNECYLDGALSSKTYWKPDIYYARGGRIITTYEVSEDKLIRARFSSNIGQSWTGNMDVSTGNDDANPRISGYQNYACVVMEDKNNGIAYNYTKDFGVTWSGSFTFVDSGDVTPAISVSPEEARYYIYYASQGTLSKLTRKSFINTQATTITAGDMSASVLSIPYSYDIIADEPTIPVCCAWVDYRNGNWHVMFDRWDRDTIPDGWEHITITADSLKPYFYQLHASLWNDCF